MVSLLNKDPEFRIMLIYCNLKQNLFLPVVTMVLLPTDVKLAEAIDGEMDGTTVDETSSDNGKVDTVDTELTNDVLLMELTFDRDGVASNFELSNSTKVELGESDEKDCMLDEATVTTEERTVNGDSEKVLGSNSKLEEFSSESVYGVFVCVDIYVDVEVGDKCPVNDVDNDTEGL